MAICNQCGQHISFIKQHGRFIPIHDGGGCPGRRGIENDIRNNFCRPTQCPKCGEQVFFVRYNGGSVWFDSLGWPWPKHPCFASVIDSFEFGTAVVNETDEPVLGIILSVYTVGKRHGEEMLVLLEDKREIKYTIEYPFPSGNDVGKLVIVSSKCGSLIEPEELKSRIKYWALNSTVPIPVKQTAVNTAMLRVAAIPPAERVKCEYCFEIFSTAAELGPYLKNHEDWPCQYCSYVTLDISAFIEHVKKQHGKNA